jgi:hypothetical protein
MVKKCRRLARGRAGGKVIRGHLIRKRGAGARVSNAKRQVARRFSRFALIAGETPALPVAIDHKNPRLTAHLPHPELIRVES